MGRRMPWDEVPDVDVTPAGIVLLKGVSLEEVQTSTGKLMYKAQMEILEPADRAGFSYFENFVIGTDDDPEASSVDTWKKSFGARNMKKMLSAAQVPQNDDLDVLCKSFENTQFLGRVVLTQDKDGDYAGIDRNQVRAFYKIGDGRHQPHWESQPSAGVKNAPMMPAGGGPQPQQAMPQQQAPPSYQQPPVQQAPPAPPTTGTPPPPPPGQQAPPAPPQQEQPAQQPQQGQAPQQPPPVAGQQGAMIKCQVCGQDVPMAELRAHLQSHGVA